MPDVSIVIPTRDSAPLLRSVFDSLAEGAGDISYEVVVVDQASEDGTVDLAIERGAKFVELDRPALYAPPTRSRNAGAEVASGEFLLHLDADMTLVDRVLERA